MISSEDAEMLMEESQRDLVDMLCTAYDVTDNLHCKVNRLEEENALLKEIIKKTKEIVKEFKEKLEQGEPNERF